MNGGWTRIMFVIGALLDGAMAVVMLTPSLEALFWDFEQPVLDPGFRFAMTLGAALMIGPAVAFHTARLGLTRRPLI